MQSKNFFSYGQGTRDKGHGEGKGNISTPYMEKKKYGHPLLHNPINKKYVFVRHFCKVWQR